jgi:hypothetical protein
MAKRKVRRHSTKNKTCESCRKYSRKTFYCAKHGKVLSKDRAACEFFTPRRKVRFR